MSVVLCLLRCVCCAVSLALWLLANTIYFKMCLFCHFTQFPVDFLTSDVCLSVWFEMFCVVLLALVQYSSSHTGVVCQDATLGILHALMATLHSDVLIKDLEDDIELLEPSDLKLFGLPQQQAPDVVMEHIYYKRRKAQQAAQEASEQHAEQQLKALQEADKNAEQQAAQLLQELEAEEVHDRSFVCLCLCLYFGSVSLSSPSLYAYLSCLCLYSSLFVSICLASTPLFSWLFLFQTTLCSFHTY